MKKIVHTLICILTFTYSVFAQWNDVGGANSLNTFLGASNFISGFKEGNQLHADNNGNLYAAGGFYAPYNNNTQYGDTNTCIVKWNGFIWQRFPLPNETQKQPLICAIATYSTNYLYTAGYFQNASNMYYVAQWNGSTWYEVGGQNALAANAPITYLCTDSVGNLYATGPFKNSAGYAYVAKWNGSQWSQYGGNITNLPPSTYGALWIFQICFDKQGNMYAIGAFRNAAYIFYVAKWDGNSWTELGGNNALQNNYEPLSSLVSDNYGNIYTAGILRNAENKPYVAKWNGTAWTELTGNNGFRIYSPVTLCTDKYNNIYASGIGADNNIIISKWNGSEWTDLAGSDYFEQGSQLTSMCTDTAGNLYAAASLFKDDYCKGYIAKYSNAHLVSIEEENTENINALLYPNPCTDKLNIKNLPNARMDISLYDITGKLVLSKTLNANEQNNEIDVSSLSKGLYIAELRVENKQMKRLKLVKE